MSPRTDAHRPTSSEAGAGGGPATGGGTADRRSRFGRFAASGRDRLGAALKPVWIDLRIGVGLAAGLAALWALIAAWWMPRGPLTTGQALWSLLISLAVGVAAGLVMRSRWAMLAAPVAFALVYELARVDTDGPTVDGIHLSTYGVLAFVVGRGFHALLSLVPLLFGATMGAGIARRLTRSASGVRPGRAVGLHLRRAVAALAAVGLVVMVAGLARPASTDAITGPDGATLPGSIAELTRVEIGGHELAMMIRGHSTDNPVLLFLAGGPGGSEMGAMRNHLAALEKRFTVVTWDQRGTGKSYTELDPTSTIAPEGYVSDTIAVTDYLRERFGQDRIYLLGQSWGSILGVLAVQERPGLFRAFIGTGQMVSSLATDRIFYRDTLTWARRTDRDGLAGDLTDIGPPPYQSVLDYETALSYEHEVYPYDHTGNSEGEGGFSENFLVPEYTLVDQVHLLAAFMDTFTALYPQIQGIDFRTQATTLEVPVFFVQGAHEARGRAEPFAQWYRALQAPSKNLTVLATSGHRPPFEQPDEFVAYMTNTVLAQTTP